MFCAFVLPCGINPGICCHECNVDCDHRCSIDKKDCDDYINSSSITGIDYGSIKEEKMKSEL